MAKKPNLTAAERSHYVLAKCVGCGAVGAVGPHEDQPMCGRCLMPMIATRACATLAKRRKDAK